MPSRFPWSTSWLRVEPGVQALVLAPTRELALQSSKEIARIGKHRGLRTVAVYGGAPMGRQIEEARRRPRIGRAPRAGCSTTCAAARSTRRACAC